MSMFYVAALRVCL